MRVWRAKLSAGRFRLIFFCILRRAGTLKLVLDAIEDPESPLGPGLSNIRLEQL